MWEIWGVVMSDEDDDDCYFVNIYVIIPLDPSLIYKLNFGYDVYLIFEYSKEEEGEEEQEKKRGKSVKFKLRSRDTEEENDQDDVYFVDGRVTDEKIGDNLLKLTYEGDFQFFEESLEYDLEILKKYPEAEAEFSIRHVGSVTTKRFSLKNGKLAVS